MPNQIFRISEGQTSAQILATMAKAELVGGIVEFEPGTYNIDGTFDFLTVQKIVGAGIGATIIRRQAQQLFRSVRDYTDIGHTPDIGGFEIENMVETSIPAIELGSCQNAKVHDIYSWGEPADLLCFTNVDPTATPPVGHAIGTWTENVTFERIIIYGPKSAGIRCKVTGSNPGQSFSHMRGEAQITLTEPGSIGVDFVDHIHLYGGRLAFKFNIDDATGTAICVNVGAECNITGNEWSSFVEGVPLYDGGGNVTQQAGYRIKVVGSAIVKGHGKFYRQAASHTPDSITPGTNFFGQPAGTVQAGILEDEGI